jgi:PAS domain S-box-containing protein
MYAAAATLVIFVGVAVVDPRADTALDLIFVAATSVVLFVLLRRRARAIQRAESERERLVAVVEQAFDSVVITDTQGAIEYVNPMFERVTGYSRDELIGQNPRILKSGVQSDEFYREMWATLAEGRAWRATFVNRRKDGTLFVEDEVISPIRDAAGRVTHYAATKRDVTAERATSKALARQTRTHAEIGAALRHIRQAETVEATAELVCAEIVSLAGVDSASVVAFEADGTARVLWAYPPLERGGGQRVHGSQHHRRGDWPNARPGDPGSRSGSQVVNPGSPRPRTGRRSRRSCR